MHCSHQGFSTHAPCWSMDSVPRPPAPIPLASHLQQRETGCGTALLWQILTGYRRAWTGMACFTSDCRNLMEHRQVKNLCCLDWSTSNRNSLENIWFQHLKESTRTYSCNWEGKGFICSTLRTLTYKSEHLPDLALNINILQKFYIWCQG